MECGSPRLTRTHNLSVAPGGGGKQIPGLTSSPPGLIVESCVTERPCLKGDGRLPEDDSGYHPLVHTQAFSRVPAFTSILADI